MSEPSEYKEPRNNDDTVPPIVRAASAAAIVTTAFGLPNIWKNLQERFPNGMGNNLASAMIKGESTFAERMAILGKHAVDLHKDPAIVGKLAAESLEREKLADLDKRTSVERNLNMFAEEQAEKTAKKNQAALLEDALKPVSSSSLFERVAMVDKAISNSDDFGRSTYKRLPPSTLRRLGESFISRPAIKSHLTPSAELKKKVVLDAIATMDKATRDSLFPSFRSFDFEGAKNLPLSVFVQDFDLAMEKGSPIAKGLAADFLDITANRRRNLLLPFTYAGKAIKLGSIRDDIVAEQRVQLRWTTDANFMKIKKDPTFEKVNKFMFGHSSVDNIMEDISQKFQHIGAKEYGNSKQNLRRLIDSMFTEIRNLHPSAREGKEFGIKVDHNKNQIIMFAVHDKQGRKIVQEAPLPIPDSMRRIGHANSSRTTDTASITKSGDKFIIGRGFERTTHELANAFRTFVHGLYLEPDPQGGESGRLRNLIRNQYATDQLSGSNLLNAYKSNIIRNTNPFVYEKSKARMNRRVGVIQHTLLAAARKSGKDFLVYDQEFVTGREGPNLVAKNPHTAYPYQVTARRITASGKEVAGKTYWIKTDQIKEVLSNFRSNPDNIEVLKFKESLRSIGKLDSMEEILEQVSKHGVSAENAYRDIFEGYGKGALRVDYGGEGGPDWAIIKNHSGVDYAKSGQNFDILKIMKASSSTKLGWGKDPQFKKIVLAATTSDHAFAKFESSIMSYAGSKSHEKLLHHYQAELKRNPRNKRKIFIEAVLAEAHDGSVDVGMETGLLNQISSNHPLMGAVNSSVANIDDIIRHSNVSWRQRTNIINRHFTLKHFGDPNVDPSISITGITDRSSNSIINGAYSGLGASTLDFFQVGNTGLKQTHQLFHQFDLNVPDKYRAGRFLNPIVSAFRESLNLQGKDAVARNIAANAESVMVKAYLMPTGFGNLPEGVIVGEKGPLQFFNREYESETTKVLLGKSGEIKDPALKNFINGIRHKYEGEYAYLRNPKGDFWLSPDFQSLMQREILETDALVAADMKAGLLETGSTKYHPIRQGQILSRSLMNSPNSLVHDTGRYSYMSFVRQENGAVEMAYRLKRLVGMEKMHISAKKGMVKIRSHNIESELIGRRPYEHADDLVRASQRPMLAVAQNFMERGEHGTLKKDLVNRVFGELYTSGQTQKAKNFLQGLGVSNVADTPQGPRIITDLNTIQQRIDALNNISIDKLYQGHIDAGLTWDRHDINLLKEFHNIKTIDAQSSANEFDKVVLDMWNRDNSKNQIKVIGGGNYTQTLNSMMDNNELKFLRMYNPYYHRDKGVVDPHNVKTARMFTDPRKRDDGRINLGLEVWVNPHTIISQHIQVPGDKIKIMRGGMFHSDYISSKDAAWNKSFEKKILDRSVGNFRHRLRTTVTDMMAVWSGEQALGGRGVRIDNGLDVMMQKTLTNNEILKDVSKGNIDIKDIDGKKFKEYQRTAWNKVTTDKYILEAEKLESDAKLDRVSTADKKLYRERAEALRKRAQISFTKPLHDFGESIIGEDITNQVGTLYEKTNRLPFTHEFAKDSTLNIGNSKIAPYDMMILNVPNNVSNVANREMFQSLLDHVHEMRAGLDASSGKSLKTRKSVDHLINSMTKYLASGEKGTIALLSPQAVTDLSNLSKEVMRSGFGSKSLTHAYEGVLMAASEAVNAKAYEFYDEKRLAESMNDFMEKTLYAITGKRKGKGFSLLYSESQTSLVSLYTQLESHSDAFLSIDRNLQNQSNNYTNTPLRKGEMKIADQISKAKLMRTGEFGLMSRSKFRKMKVGDVNIVTYLKDTLGIEKTRAILKGKEAIPLMIGRYPFETNDMKIGTVEFFIHHEKDRVFKDLPKGVVLGQKILEEINGDLDGDNVAVAFADIQNLKEYEQFQASYRNRRARQNKLIANWQKKALATGNYGQATDSFMDEFKKLREQGLDDLYGTKVSRTELRHVAKLAENITKTGIIRTEAIDEAAGIYADRSIEDALYADTKLQKFRRMGNMNAAEEQIRRFITPQHELVFRSEMIAKAKIQTLAAHGIGVVSSKATRTAIKLRATQKYISELVSKGITPELMADLKQLNMFTDVDFKNPNAIAERANQVIEDHLIVMDDLIDNVNEAFREPEQFLISGKKIDIPKDGTRIVSDIIHHSEDIFEERFAEARHAIGLDKLNAKSILKQKRETEALYSTIEQQDKLFSLDVQHQMASASSDGITVPDFQVRQALKFFKNYASGMSPEDIISSGALEDIYKKPSKFASDAAGAWRKSVKQVLHMNSTKSLGAMAIGLSLLNFGNPNQMSGGISDFGIDLGHRPGIKSESGIGIESLDAEPGNDVFEKKWTYLLKNDPLLKDNMSNMSGKSYKDMTMNSKSYGSQNPSKKYKRNYIDYRKQYNSRYETNDMRRARIPNF